MDAVVVFGIFAVFFTLIGVAIGAFIEANRWARHCNICIVKTPSSLTEEEIEIHCMRLCRYNDIPDYQDNCDGLTNFCVIKKLKDSMAKKGAKL